MKKLLFTLAIGLVTLTSCESDLVSAPPSDSVDGGVNDGVLVTKIIDDTGIETDYTYNGNKLTKQEDNDGFSETYTYTGELLTKSVEVYEGITYIDNLEYDSSNRLMRVTDGDGIMKYEYTYNADGTITQTETSGGQTIYTYVNGNLISEDYVGGEYDYSFTYDDKNNPIKNIHQSEVFELLGYYAYSNNLLTQQYDGNEASYETITTTYTYNENGYPATSTEVLSIYFNSTLETNETITSQYFY